MEHRREPQIPSELECAGSLDEKAQTPPPGNEQTAKTADKTSELGVSKPNEYRAYIFGDDKHIANMRSFICDNDADATVWAKQLMDENDIELWCGGRLVVRLKAAGKSGAVTHEVREGRMVPTAK